jgi:hypothetical protein
MQVVIDIPETYYEYCKKLEDAIEIQLAVKNGTPLPKGCKRLVNADDLEECKEIMNTIDGESKYAVRMDDIRNVEIQL